MVVFGPHASRGTSKKREENFKRNCQKPLFCAPFLGPNWPSPALSLRYVKLSDFGVCIPSDPGIGSDELPSDPRLFMIFS